MKIATALVLGTVLVLCGEAAAVNAATKRIYITPNPQPYWASYLVPRYRYRPEDDRVDPCGGPVIPVIRVGPQEETIPMWLAHDLGLGQIHGRDWPCRRR